MPKMQKAHWICNFVDKGSNGYAATYS